MARPSSRDALIIAALEEFTEQGYEAATVTDIAERAGVTTGALYAHFRGKLDLLLQALGIAPASTVMKDLAEVATQPWAQVAHLFSQNMAATPDDAALLLLDAIVAARRDDGVARTLQAGFASYEEAITRAAETGALIGVIDPAMPARDLVRMLTLLSLGRLVVAAIDGGVPSEDAFDRLAELLLQSSGTATAVASGSDDPLGRVRSRAKALEQRRDDLADSVAVAVEAGHSLRQVGDAAGLSHERVRQIVREHAGPVARALT